MRLIPSSFNGFLFQQKAKVNSTWATPYDWDIRGIQTSNVPRSQNFPLFAAKGYSGSVKVVNVFMSCVDADRDDLIRAMDVLGENQHKLFALDEFGNSWYVNAICVALNEESVDGNNASFGAVFDVDDVIWKKDTLGTQIISVNTTGSGTITPAGNQAALPVITITPTASGAGGFAYSRFVQITNNSDNALTMYPLNLTGAGLDTSALVGAGKMLASGEDLRVYVDGAEVKRWLQDMNSANTKIWINWTQPAKSDMTLGEVIAATGTVSTIEIQNTTANNLLLPNIPTNGNVLIGSEIFVYTGVDIALRQLTGVTRAERQTSAAAHAIADAIKFVTHDVWIYYGYPTIPAYVVDDTNKPIIKLTSTNTSHIYEEFSNVAGGRTGAWVQSLYNLYAPSRIYTATQNTDTDPASVMGVAIVNTSYGSYVYGKWLLYNPCGITHITATGLKYTTYTSWSKMELYKSISGIDVAQVWVESTPTLSTWSALDAHSAVSLSGTHYYLYFLQRDYGVSAAQTVYSEISDITLAIDATKVPTITIAAEQSVISLYSVLTNTATGDVMILSLSMLANTSLVVNTKEKTITLYDGSNQINALQNMPVRAEWFQLLPQANLITITDAGVVTYLFEWEARSL